MGPMRARASEPRVANLAGQDIDQLGIREILAEQRRRVRRQQKIPAARTPRLVGSGTISSIPSVVVTGIPAKSLGPLSVLDRFSATVPAKKPVVLHVIVASTALRWYSGVAERMSILGHSTRQGQDGSSLNEPGCAMGSRL